MNTPDNLTEQITHFINVAWPCFVHYADPADLLGEDSQQALKKFLDALATIEPIGERLYDATVVPSPGELTEDMAHGHEHHAACLALTVAVARCIPALAQSLTDGSWRGGSDQHAVRHAMLAAHTRHHRLDPACGAPDGEMVEALTSLPERPVETGPAWRFMVRLTHEAMGGEVNAFGFMPMRCFVQLEQARNWSLVQAMWECVLLEDNNPLLNDPRQLAVIAEIERYDGTGERVWRLPSTGAHLHLTPRGSGV